MDHELKVVQGESSEEDTQLRREYPRVSLRANREQPLIMACDGLTIRVLTKGLFFFKYLGIANIKDISVGGAGLLMSYPFNIGDEVYIKHQDMRLKCEIRRFEPIKGALGFYGVKWLDADDKVLKSFIKAAKQHIK